MQTTDPASTGANAGETSATQWRGLVSYWGTDGMPIAAKSSTLTEAQQAAFAPGLLLVCEHASNDFADHWADLGLDAQARVSHIAWDPGALGLAKRLAAKLAPVTGGTVLVHAPLSRLIYDLNRSPGRPDAMPEQSEHFKIPGNQGLTAAERLNRTQALYLPFHTSVQTELAKIMAQQVRPIVLTIHSFTPVYLGQQRSVEFGVIHDADPTLARAIVEAANDSGLDTRLNEPYSAADHVTHTLRLHATPHDLPHAMLELRNDLLATRDAESELANTLTTILTNAFNQLGTQPCLAS